MTNQNRVALAEQYARRWEPLAAEALARMFVPHEDAYCALARCDATGSIVLSGVSSRYTAMVLIGLAAQAAQGNAVDFPSSGAWDRTAAWGWGAESLGDVGLALWGLALRGDDRAGRLIDVILARREEVLAERGDFASMEMGWLLTGLSEAIAAGATQADIRGTARSVSCRLLENQCAETGLFCFSRVVRARNIHRMRVNACLGSFASQVYPMIGLCRYVAATGDREPLPAAVRCAEAICSLQGPQGQWWWIYHVRKGSVALRYPVYSVHQDAMGPMALLAVGKLDETLRYDAAIAKSLAWMDQHPELPERRLVEEGRGMIWRAIQRCNPSRAGRLGLSARERLRMHLSAWTGREDRRAMARGFVCDVCRPYHMGWVLLAGAMARGSRP